jgi:hypothetical protein
MKNALLKNIVLSGSIAMMAAGAAFADQTPTDAQAQIGAQLGITHDSITQLLSKMDQQSQTSDGMAHADYKIKAIQEHAKVQAALDQFESYLRDNLFPEVRSDLVTYNSIYTSNEYSDAQKQSLLANMEKQLNSLFSNASDRYTAAVYKVLAAMGPDFQSFAASLQERAEQSGYIKTRLDEDFNSFASTFYANSVLPTLQDGCYSRSCISLSSADQIILFTVASDSFGKPITFKTLDGKAFFLTPFTNISDRDVSQADYNSTSVGTFLSVVSSYYVETLSSTDQFPQYIQDMPFDIAADQIAAAQQAEQQAAAAAQRAILDGLLAKRTQAIADLTRHLSVEVNWTSEDVKGSITGICSIGQGSNFVCQQGLGCPSSEDFQKMFTGADQNTSWKKNAKDTWKSVRNDLTEDAKSGGGFSCSK